MSGHGKLCTDGYASREIQIKTAIQLGSGRDPNAHQYGGERGFGKTVGGQADRGLGPCGDPHPAKGHIPDRQRRGHFLWRRSGFGIVQGHKEKRGWPCTGNGGGCPYQRRSLCEDLGGAFVENNGIESTVLL